MLYYYYYYEGDHIALQVYIIVAAPHLNEEFHIQAILKFKKNLNNFPLQNGLRVLTFDRHHVMLVVSKPSPNNLFPGYGIVKVKLNISLQKYCHVSLKFVGLQCLHIKVCFLTYFTELCWCLVQLNLKTGFHMIVRIIPVVSKNVQTIGMIIWKHYPDDRKWAGRLRQPRLLG